MKTFDWANLLRHHPIFSSLQDKYITSLLDDEVSAERKYPPGALILQAGEIGDSVFIVGVGTVEAVLPGVGGRTIVLSIMRRGEVFGEMAFFERRPRSATVIAREGSTVLEIGGRQFRTLIDEHPDIEFKVLLKVSERLRNANEQILTAHFKGVDEKLQLFNEKLDVEHRIVDASLKAAQAVFDQTKLRADEVINAAERSKTRMTAAAAAVMGVVTLAGTAIGALGIKEYLNIQQVLTQVTDARDKAQQAKATIETLLPQAKESEREARTIADNLRYATDDIRLAKEAAVNDLRRKFRDEVVKNNDNEAEMQYRRLRALDPSSSSISESLFQIEERIRSGDTPFDWDRLLGVVLEDARASKTLSDELWTRYLLLANAMLLEADKPGRFEQGFKAFEREVQRYKGSKLESAEACWPRLKEALDKDPRHREQLAKVERIVASR